MGAGAARPLTVRLAPLALAADGVLSRSLSISMGATPDVEPRLLVLDADNGDGAGIDPVPVVPAEEIDMEIALDFFSS